MKNTIKIVSDEKTAEKINKEIINKRKNGVISHFKKGEREEELETNLLLYNGQIIITEDVIWYGELIAKKGEIGTLKEITNTNPFYEGQGVKALIKLKRSKKEVFIPNQFILSKETFNGKDLYRSYFPFETCYAISIEKAKSLKLKTDNISFEI